MSKKVVRALSAALLLLALIAAGLYIYHPAPRTITVTRTGDTFIPSTIVIRKGDSIRFVNDTSSAFWPASNAHPSHGLYPEFDPKEPIVSGGSWTFTFTKAGTWGFHDHMHAASQGVITVRGIPEDGVAGCLLRYSESTLSPQCWEADVARAIRTKGIDGAFAYVEQAYATQERFRRNCHDVMHLIGSSAYEEFAAGRTASFHEGASFCGFGFYHGFIEKMLVSEGPAHYEQAKTYCEDLQRTSGPRAGGPCFHGIGHAVFDSLDSSLWNDGPRMAAAGTAICERVLSDTEARSKCVSGIHNSYANAMSAHTYGLTFKDIDSVAFCHAQKSEYQDSCLGEIVIASIRDKHYTRAENLAILSTLTGAERTRAYYFFFDDELKREFSRFNVHDFANACMALGNPAWINSCIEGVVQGVNEESKPDALYKIVFPFCEALPNDTYKRFCTQALAMRTDIGTVASPPYRALCTQLWGDASAKECGR